MPARPDPPIPRDRPAPAGTAPASSSIRFWAYAAVFGGLWGAAEVGLGSLLHALRVPRTGQILTCVGIAVLSSQRRLLPRRGLSLATGAIASLCKSASPGGSILGPMLGIFMEALLFEAATLPVPRSRVLAAVGGTLALYWTIVQNIAVHLVTYGTRVIELYLELLKKAGALLGMSAAQGWTVLALVGVVLALFGTAAAEAGRALGEAARLRVEQSRSRANPSP
jgi:hypothetical protein